MQLLMDNIVTYKNILQIDFETLHSTHIIDFE